MAFAKEKYPSNWKEISLKIKEDCEWKCSFCGVEDKSFILKGSGKYIKVSKERSAEKNVFQVHLSTIHLNGDTTDNRDENLTAACQLCHLHYDQDQHSATRKYGPGHKDSHQLNLF